jgi:hypothetical protein
MAGNITPIFPKAARIGTANVSTANAARTVTGVTGLVSLLVAGADGTRIDRIRVKATAATTSGMIRIWGYSGSGDAQLLFEIPVSAVVPSATLASFEAYVDVAYENLPAGHTLYASTEKAEAFNVMAFGGDW